MTAEQAIEQKIDFAYGNLAASTNHVPKSKEAVAAIAWKAEWLKEHKRANELTAYLLLLKEALENERSRP